MTKTTLVLATQDHIEKGNLPQSYIVQVFDALIQGKELFIDSKEFTGLDLNKEIIKVINVEKSKSSQMDKLIKLVSTKCTSSKGTMLVEFDGVKSAQDVFERIIDEIVSLEIIIDSSDVEEEYHFDMTTREAKGLLKKMKTFVKGNAIKWLSEEDADRMMNEIK